MSDDLINVEALEAQMNEFNRQLDEIKKKSIETSKNVFHGAISNFFKSYPEVAAITWTQYTPYFNDGDTCEFSVNDVNFLDATDFKDLDEGEINYNDLYDHNPWEAPDEYIYRYAKAGGSDASYYQQKIDAWEAKVAEVGPRFKELGEGVNKFKKIFHSISDDTMLALFGDHVRVTATPKGIDIDEYDHD
jgi:hypothetical protein